MDIPLRKILIVGGGFSGLSAAIQLRKLGCDVDIVEQEKAWRTDGAGISLGGATFRAFKQLGVLDEFMHRGAASDGVQICSPIGDVVATLPTPRIAGPEIPGNGGIMRPVLGRILADAATASGARCRMGLSFSQIAADEEGVDVVFTDGSKARYDLLIGADGLNSRVRAAHFPEAPRPAYSGQAVWRAVLPRPREITTVRMWLGPKTKPGVNPVSASDMYLFVTEDRPVNDWVNPADFTKLLCGLLAPFPAPLLQAIAAQIDDQSKIVFRPLEGILMRTPWFKGRIVLIGDAVHATTPHLASGACIGIEDAIVLAEELDRCATVAAALEAFWKRRFERCRMVVENSFRLGEIEKTGGDKAEHARIMRESLIALAQPI